MDVDDAAAADIARLCRASVDLLDVTAVGVSVITPTGNRGRVGASNDLAVQIEELQFSLGEGPCIDAFTHDMPVMVADLAGAASTEAARWPVFADAAERAGVRAIFALPLRSGSRLVGAIDLIRDRPGPLNRDRLKLAHAIADVAASTLLSLATDDSELFLDNEGDRSSYRLEVHQATGMVSVQLGIPVDDALARLRAEAFAAGRPIGEVAADVVSRRVRFPQEGDE